MLQVNVKSVIASLRLKTTITEQIVQINIHWLTLIDLASYQLQFTPFIGTLN